MVMDRFTIENEGTYTVQIHDGKAKSQSSLVLIGDGMQHYFCVPVKENSKKIVLTTQKQTSFISFPLKY